MICNSAESLNNYRCTLSPVLLNSLYNPVNLTGYDNDNISKLSTSDEESGGIYVMVNKMLDASGNKVSKNFQDSENPTKLDMPAEARKLTLTVKAPDDGNSETSINYTVKLKLESADTLADDKVIIWQVPEDGFDGFEDNQKAWVIKVGGNLGMTPTSPVMNLAEGDEKTLTFWLEGRKPVVDANKPITLVAELYKDSDTEPMVTDVVKLNPIEILYLKPIIGISGIPDISNSSWTSPPICDSDSGQTGWCELLSNQLLAADGGFINQWKNDGNTCGDCERPDVYAAGDGCELPDQCRLKLTANRVDERYDWFKIRYEGVDISDLDVAYHEGERAFERIDFISPVSVIKSLTPQSFNESYGFGFYSDEFVVKYSGQDIWSTNKSHIYSAFEDVESGSKIRLNHAKNVIDGLRAKSNKKDLRRKDQVNEFEMYCHDMDHSGEEYLLVPRYAEDPAIANWIPCYFRYLDPKGEVTQVELTAVDEAGKGQLLLSETDLTPAMGGNTTLFMTNDTTGGFTEFFVLGYRKSESVFDAVIEARPTGNEGVRAPKRGLTVVWSEKENDKPKIRSTGYADDDNHLQKDVRPPNLGCQFYNNIERIDEQTGQLKSGVLGVGIEISTDIFPNGVDSSTDFRIRRKKNHGFSQWYYTSDNPIGSVYQEPGAIYEDESSNANWTQFDSRPTIYDIDHPGMEIGGNGDLSENQRFRRRISFTTKVEMRITGGEWMRISNDLSYRVDFGIIKTSAECIPYPSSNCVESWECIPDYSGVIEADPADVVWP